MSQEIKKRTDSQGSGRQCLKYSVGIDLSKDKFDACISVIDFEQDVRVIATRSFANTSSGFNEFLIWQSAKCKLDIPLVFTMEATGIYYEKLAWFLHRKDFYVSVVLPNKAKKYFQSIGVKSKNDRIDSAGLARMGAEQKLQQWMAPKKIIMELRDLTRYRESLQESKTRFNNQLSAYQCGEFVDQMVSDGLKEIIATLNEKIRSAEKLIRQKINSDEQLKAGTERICEIKGVSTISLVTVLAETNCFEMFNSQGQLVSYAGYDVVENQSGKHVGKTKISKKGNSRIRRILHMPALNMVTYGEPVFVNLYERVYSRTKIKMKAYVAVQRKLLCLIYTLWKRGEKYQRNYKDEHPVMQSRSSSFRLAS